MRIDVLTIFPDMFAAMDHTIPAKAKKHGALDLRVHGLRKHAVNKYGAVDDYPFGGEAGMVLRPEPIEKTLEDALEGRTDVPVFFPCPHGKPLNQEMVREWAKLPEMVILCGHYKGIDERIRYTYVTHEFSLGDFVLSGGELPAMVFIDALARLQPGVLGDDDSANTDSFESSLLGWPVYTRPETWHGLKAPQALLSGDHERIRKWRRQQQLLWTKERRPDLLERLELTSEDHLLLNPREDVFLPLSTKLHANSRGNHHEHSEDDPVPRPQG